MWNDALKAIISDMQFSIQTVKQWGVKGGLAILDQGFFSGSNFILNILLARWLSVSYYGAFSIGFALFLFVTGIYNSLILEPMTVLGPSKFEHRKVEYILSQFKLHMWITFLLGFPSALIGVVMSKDSGTLGLIGETIWGMGLFLPLIMLNWLVRRIFYVLQNPIGSFISSTIYAISIVGGSFLVHKWLREPNLPSWFVLMGIAGLISGVIPIILCKKNLQVKDVFPKLSPMEVLTEHWQFGRWVMIATIFYFMAMQIQLFSAAIILDVDAGGIWRAMQNFILPMLQIITAITTLSLPTMAFDFGKANFVMLKRKAGMVLAALLMISLAYELILILYSPYINKIFYGNKFAEFTELIPIIGLVPILAAVEAGFSLILRTLQRPAYYLIYTLAMSVGGLLLGPLLILVFDLTGAAMSQLLVGFCSLSINVYLYRIWFSKYKRASSFV